MPLIINLIHFGRLYRGLRPVLVKTGFSHVDNVRRYTADVPGAGRLRGIYGP